ncbi:cryptic protein-like [Lutra lutra]|uniref:cryptic protein-like n=1 Tax=Lutra lutra TaxID=9657 RepID=UPI001FCFB559|nr:cryptic protein-like [Lutra lutra]
MTWRHPVRLLFFVSLALHIIHLGDNNYQKKKHKANREEINNATAQKLQQETLNWILNNLGEGNGSMDGWQPQDSSTYFRAFSALAKSQMFSTTFHPFVHENGGHKLRNRADDWWLADRDDDDMKDDDGYLEEFLAARSNGQSTHRVLNVLVLLLCSLLQRLLREGRDG